jgi:hypothetical protein
MEEFVLRQLRRRTMQVSLPSARSPSRPHTWSHTQPEAPPGLQPLQPHPQGVVRAGSALVLSEAEYEGSSSHASQIRPHTRHAPGGQEYSSNSTAPRSHALQANPRAETSPETITTRARSSSQVLGRDSNGQTHHIEDRRPSRERSLSPSLNYGGQGPERSASRTSNHSAKQAKGGVQREHSLNGDASARSGSVPSVNGGVAKETGGGVPTATASSMGFEDEEDFAKLSHCRRAKVSQSVNQSRNR